MEGTNQTVTTLKELPKFCQNCGSPLAENEYFCHNCGKKIKDQDLSISILRQIYIYVISILLPPTGLWWGIKYLRQNNQKARMVGIIAMVLTVLTLIVSYIVITNFINSYMKQYEDIMQEYQNLGL